MPDENINSQENVSPPEGTNDTNAGATSSDDANQTTPPPDKFSLDGAEYTAEQLREALKARKTVENMDKWESSLHKKGEQLNEAMREVLATKNEIERERNELRQFIDDQKKQPPIDLNSIDDPVERAQAHVRLLESQLRETNSRYDQIQKAIEAKEQMENQQKQVVKWNTELKDTVDDFSEGLNATESKMLDKYTRASIAEKLPEHWTPDFFRECGKEARERIDELRKYNSAQYAEEKKKVIQENKIIKQTPSTPPPLKNPFLAGDPFEAAKICRENIGG